MQVMTSLTKLVKVVPLFSLMSNRGSNNMIGKQDI